MAIIQLTGVSKCFRLRPDRSRSIQDLLIHLLRSRLRGRQEQLFWALEDVSFKVQPGETVGVIGANGSGKSTLLKLLTRIIEPTSGDVQVNGRVAALLELGAGFHPDLTGRDNVFLNGAILGIPRREMARRFDGIVAFAELERFIDIPVKFYSSGMYVRLAFATAISVDARVLLVDEVLAVGDQRFQQKCLRHIAELKRGGVTILYVSHDLDEVRRLCDRGLWLHNGVLRADGTADQAVNAYLEHVAGLDGGGRKGESPPDEPRESANSAARRYRRWGTGEAEIVGMTLEDAEGRRVSICHAGQPVRIVIHYRAKRRIAQPVFGMALHREDGLHVTGSNTVLDRQEIAAIEGEGQVRCVLPDMPLAEGRYYLSLSLHDVAQTTFYDCQEWAYEMVVAAGAPAGGVVRLATRWEHGADGVVMARGGRQ